ncbi:MAG TPA: glycosyltransferase family 4 protein [Pyrinomonadaceae bacterium]|jgi:glycosyltransferase involved in cell wall biosynthesis|nr:glycosyltransferase family 4 protein [Pyrinomonadaceae bacterium]
MNSIESPMNVLIVTSEYPPEIVGGLGTHVFELAHGIGRLGCEAHVLAPSKFKRTVNDGPNVTVHFFSNEASAPDPAAAMQWFIDLNKNCVLEARRLIVKGGLRPDVIHCHDWLNFPAAYQLGKLYKIPVVGTVHLLQNPIVKWWGDSPQAEIVKQERDLCRKSDALITVSRSMRELITGTHGISEGQVHVVYNGMDVQHFTKPRMTAAERDELRRSFAAPGDKIVIYAGRLTPQKGIPALIESAARVMGERKDVHYVIAGAPDFTQELWDAARITEEARKMFSGFFHDWDRLHMVGRISRERLAALYEISDVAVVPSLYEPFGYAAVEAMAAGLPVIASEVGGLAEIVLEGETGLLVPVSENEAGWHEVDVEKLCAANHALLGDPELRARMGRAGRRRVLSEFNSDRMAAATLDVYRRCVSRAGAESSAATDWPRAAAPAAVPAAPAL